MKILCEYCESPTEKTKWDVNNFKHLFCSRNCKELFYKEKNKEDRVCPECNSVFETTKKSSKKFCNNSCAASYNNKNNLKETECKNCLVKFKRKKTGKVIDNYCSDNCYDENKLKTIKKSKGRKIPIKIAVQKWRTKTKEKIVATMGGECEICGYKKSNNALDLHHLNPDEKELSIANCLKNPKKWSTIESELKKCVLLCGNCHREVHAGITSIENKMYFKKIKEDKKLEEKKLEEKDLCPICHEEKSIKLKFCSPTCYKKSREKVNWDELNFEELILKFKNNEQIGKYLGVSGAAVRKQRLKRGV